jgi:hypothetical protein
VATRIDWRSAWPVWRHICIHENKMSELINFIELTRETGDPAAELLNDESVSEKVTSQV